LALSQVPLVAVRVGLAGITPRNHDL
jgi:hypothetical protein